MKYKDGSFLNSPYRFYFYKPDDNVFKNKIFYFVAILTYMGSFLPYPSHIPQLPHKVTQFSLRLKVLTKPWQEETHIDFLPMLCKVF